MNQTTAGPTLARRLTLRDMVLLNIVAVISLRWLATSAATGPSAFVLWVLAALFWAASTRGRSAHTETSTASSVAGATG